MQQFYLHVNTNYFNIRWWWISILRQQMKKNRQLAPPSPTSIYIIIYIYIYIYIYVILKNVEWKLGSAQLKVGCNSNMHLPRDRPSSFISYIQIDANFIIMFNLYTLCVCMACGGVCVIMSVANLLYVHVCSSYYVMQLYVYNVHLN